MSKVQKKILPTKSKPVKPTVKSQSGKTTRNISGNNEIDPKLPPEIPKDSAVKLSETSKNESKSREPTVRTRSIGSKKISNSVKTKVKESEEGSKDEDTKIVKNNGSIKEVNAKLSKEKHHLQGQDVKKKVSATRLGKPRILERDKEPFRLANEKVREALINKEAEKAKNNVSLDRNIEQIGDGDATTALKKKVLNNSGHKKSKLVKKKVLSKPKFQLI